MPGALSFGSKEVVMHNAFYCVTPSGSFTWQKTAKDGFIKNIDLVTLQTSKDLQVISFTLQNEKDT